MNNSSKETTPDVSLPRILCLHGGGASSQAFRRQCRSLKRALSPYFRLVFADGPFICEAGPDISSVYAACGPFRRWLRWLPEHPGIDDREAAVAIEECIRQAMKADDDAGGRGDWIGLLGFSQGGKVAASVLFETQLRKAKMYRGPGQQFQRNIDEGIDDGNDKEGNMKGYAGGNWLFAVLLASRAPLVALSDLSSEQVALDKPGALLSSPVVGERWNNDCRLQMPTVHVHGLRDPGLCFHRALLEDFTRLDCAEVVEWDGDHRVPIKRKEVDDVLQATLRAARRAVSRK